MAIWACTSGGTANDSASQSSSVSANDEYAAAPLAAATSSAAWARRADTPAVRGAPRGRGEVPVTGPGAPR
jgi:hypothetical protein